MTMNTTSVGNNTLSEKCELENLFFHKYRKLLSHDYSIIALSTAKLPILEILDDSSKWRLCQQVESRVTPSSVYIKPLRREHLNGFLSHWTTSNNTLIPIIRFRLFTGGNLPVGWSHKPRFVYWLQSEVNIWTMYLKEGRRGVPRLHNRCTQTLFLLRFGSLSFE